MARSIGAAKLQRIGGKRCRDPEIHLRKKKKRPSNRKK